VSRSFCWGPHERQVADPMIEAAVGLDHGVGHPTPFAPIPRLVAAD